MVPESKRIVAGLILNQGFLVRKKNKAVGWVGIGSNQQ